VAALWGVAAAATAARVCVLRGVAGGAAVGEVAAAGSADAAAVALAAWPPPLRPPPHGSPTMGADRPLERE